MPIGRPQVPNLNLKVLFLIHFVFLSFSFMGLWHTDSYFFYNSVFMLFLIWSILHEKSQEALQLAIVCNVTAVALDIMVFIMCFWSSGGSARDKFSLAVAIIHLLIRPLSTFYLLRNLEERGGNIGNIHGMFAGNRTESYEDIDRTASASSPSQNPQGPHASGGYNFATAQQI